VTDFIRFYDERIRPLETKEFCDWWENWYGTDTEFKKTDLYHEFLSEKRWALLGWVARTEEPEVRNSKEFLQTLLDRLGDDFTRGEHDL